ncbi:hypothetical protein G980_04823 [Escherichia coli UMEA 3617-1]|nr:hypothetical protein G980_04823 [Escherichia coli UMEA 3617-1]
MYGTCETLCRELAVKYPGDMPLMLVIWSPEEIQALADGMDISLSDHEIRTVLARLEDIPEDQRTESGISSGVAMEIINNVSENRQVTVPAELLASLIQTAEQALWKREWAARDGTVAKLAMRQPFVLFKGLTFQKLCLPGAFRPGDHHNKMLRPGLCVVHASPQYL